MKLAVIAAATLVSQIIHAFSFRGFPFSDLNLGPSSDSQFLFLINSDCSARVDGATTQPGLCCE